MKVSLCIRQRGTRQFQKHNPKKSYPHDRSIIWVLRYGSTWETLNVKTLSEATSLRLRRQIDSPTSNRSSDASDQPDRVQRQASPGIEIGSLLQRDDRG